MSMLTKLALGAVGRLRAKPLAGDADSAIPLPPPDKAGGAPLMQALARRQSAREFASRELPLPMLSNLLWAANGVNRDDGKRTAPSAMGVQEIDVYVALPTGAYLYDADAHALRLVAGNDVRRVTGYQDFVDAAPLGLVYVADYSRMTFVPAGMRQSYACAVAGAIMQNVYLFAAGNGLAAVIRSWIDKEALAAALGLGDDQEALLSQTVGFPKS
jgi:SagB-type dehydrogenase family enzyme